LILTPAEKVGVTLITLLLGAFAVVCVLPFLLVVAASVTEEAAIIKYGYQLWPKAFSLKAYQLIFTNAQNPVARSYGVTVLVTLAGTLLNVAMTSMAAFTLSNKKVACRDGLALYFFVTMVFGGGLVPWYMMCRNLGLTNNLFSLIVPNLLFSPFNLFLIRNFMNGIPDSLRESAVIDGARDPVILFRIYYPLCTPVLATVALFSGLAYWNDWFNAIMLVDNSKLYPLQYLLFKIQSEIEALKTIQQLGAGGATVGIHNLPSEGLKMATVVVTVGPIILLYPFLQKYFVKGLLIGAVKG
jgi:putative aldouronate transport system permease protein